MPCVQFRRGEMLLAEVEAEPGQRLLDLALAHSLPLHWRCGQGTCGTCRVWLLIDSAGQRTRMEENVLLNTLNEPCLEREGECLRLACHVKVGVIDLTVELP